MSLVFNLIFILFTVDNVQGKNKTEDDHPFTAEDSNLPSNVKAQDKFMLIPSVGYEVNDTPNKFTLILNGWHYEPLKPSFVKTFFQVSFHSTLHLFDKSETLSEKNKEERLGPFFVRDVKDHKIQLTLSDSISKSVTTDDNGRFHSKIIVDTLNGLDVEENRLRYIASDDDSAGQQNEGFVYLMKKENRGGCSIISDIDDTIKISEVTDKKRLIVNTFKKDFQVVPGMSDIYQSWHSSYKCLIHYVSAMPSQLYYVTQKFLHKENFPGGSFHMRHLKLVSSMNYDLMNKIFDFIKHDASRQHKLTVIQNILDHAPSTQQFIMVGDSGELDPEIYGEITRKYSNRIKMIFIRLVQGGNNDDTRFKVAFNGIPPEKWNVFTDANELPRKLYADDDPINHNDVDDNPTNDRMNSAIKILTSLTHNMFSILLIFYFQMKYV